MAVYLYNIKNDVLNKEQWNSIAISEVKITTFNSETYILPASIFASGNTVSISELQQFSVSAHPDTIELYERYKNKAYQFGDFAVYTMLYNSNIKHVFSPIEHYGWTKYSNADFLQINNNLHIVSLIKSGRDTTFTPTLYLTNLKGETTDSLSTDNHTIRFFLRKETNEILL